MRRLKALLKKWAGKIVTYYYTRLYDKAVLLADQKHAEKKETYYVIDHFLKGQLLSVINRKEFRWIKRQAQRTGRKIYWSAEYGTPMLRKQAWYHTPDGSEQNGLSPREIEIRKLAFIRSGLKKAKLL